MLSSARLRPWAFMGVLALLGVSSLAHADTLQVVTGADSLLGHDASVATQTLDCGDVSVAVLEAERYSGESGTATYSCSADPVDSSTTITLTWSDVGAETFAVSALSTATYEGPVEGASIFPPLSAAQGAALGSAILALWSIPVIFRALQKMLQAG